MLPDTGTGGKVDIYATLLGGSHGSKSEFPETGPAEGNGATPAGAYNSGRTVPTIPEVVVIVDNPSSGSVGAGTPTSSFIPCYYVVRTWDPPLIVSVTTADTDIRDPTGGPASAPYSKVVHRTVTTAARTATVFIAADMPSLHGAIPITLGFVSTPVRGGRATEVNAMPMVVPLIGSPGCFPTPNRGI